LILGRGYGARSVAGDVSPMNQPEHRSAIEATAPPVRERPIKTSTATHSMQDARYAAIFSLTRTPFVGVKSQGRHRPFTPPDPIPSVLTRSPTTSGRKSISHTTKGSRTSSHHAADSNEHFITTSTNAPSTHFGHIALRCERTATSSAVGACRKSHQCRRYVVRRTLHSTSLAQRP
jgi:hypothetical protein